MMEEFPSASALAPEHKTRAALHGVMDHLQNRAVQDSRSRGDRPGFSLPGFWIVGRSRKPRASVLADSEGLALPAFDGRDLRLKAESFFELRSVARYGPVPAISCDRLYSQDLRAHGVPAFDRARGRRTPNPEGGCSRRIREPVLPRRRYPHGG